MPRLNKTSAKCNLTIEPWPPYNEVCFVRLKVLFSARNFPFDKKKKKKKKASQQMFKSGQAQGEGQARADKMMESAQGAADATRAKASAQQCKEEAGGVLHQTGERVVNMAQGAVDSVKNTLRMGDSNKKS